MQLKIVKSAHKTIEEECIKSKYVETGGQLIGLLNEPIVIQASTPGPLSQKTKISFVNDTVHDEKVLKEAIKNYQGRVKLIGFWHKHPGQMTYPSYGDLVEAQSILKDIEQDNDTRPMFFIIATVNKRVKLNGYALASDKLHFNEVNLSIIDDGSEEVKQALANEPMLIQPQNIDFWGDEDFQWYKTNYGSKRLKQENDALTKAGYKVKAYAKDSLFFIIEKNNEIIRCVTPKEYPLNPPRLFKDNREIIRNLPIWNSSFMVIDILEYLEKIGVSKKGRQNENLYTKTTCSHKCLTQIKKAIATLWLYARKGRNYLYPFNRQKDSRNSADWRNKNR